MTPAVSRVRVKSTVRAGDRVIWNSSTHSDCGETSTLMSLIEHASLGQRAGIWLRVAALSSDLFLDGGNCVFSFYLWVMWNCFIFAFDFLLGRRRTQAPLVIIDNVGKQPKFLEKMTKDVVYYFVYNVKDLFCCY